MAFLYRARGINGTNFIVGAIPTSTKATETKQAKIGTNTSIEIICTGVTITNTELEKNWINDNWLN